jgi:hypothetical protein
MTVELRWFAQSTRQLPSGGFSVSDEFGSLLIDGTTSENYENPAEATEHPVERDANITDHYRRGLRTITLECIVSSDPSDPRLQGDDDRVGTVLSTLTNLQERKVAVDLFTDRGSFPNYFITMVGDRREPTTGNCATFQLMLREFRVATAQEVEAPAPSLENLRRRRDRGRQPATDTGDGNEVSGRGGRRSRQQRESALRSALNSLTGALGGGG